MMAVAAVVSLAGPAAADSLWKDGSTGLYTDKCARKVGDLLTVLIVEEVSGSQDASATKARILRGMVKKETTGWQPTCKCGPVVRSPVVPCTVLDPFAGSFTTCMVALELGRRAIGIELNPAYVELGRRRCAITPGLPLAI